MKHERDKLFGNALLDIEKRRDELFEEFADFANGFRVLLLLQRTKDGGNSSDEEKRMFESYTTTNPEEFKDKLFNLLLIKASSNKMLRIYLSANPRNPNKVIRYIEQTLIDAHYADETCRNSTYKKLLKKPRHFLMQPQNKEGSLFIIDVDNEEGKDIMGEVLTEMARLDVIEVKRYRTKSGWHIVVEPFNLALWKHKSEVKKDPLILLDW